MWRPMPTSLIYKYRNVYEISRQIPTEKMKTWKTSLRLLMFSVHALNALGFLVFTKYRHLSNSHAWIDHAQTKIVLERGSSLMV